MSKLIKIIWIASIIITCTSCATIFCGKVTPYQKTKPAPGEPRRKIRPVALIADIVIFWPGAIIDFATGAIYKPLKSGEETPDQSIDPNADERMF